MEYTREQIYEKGLEAIARERADLIDNCYRAGIIKDYSNVPETTETLRKKYDEYWKTR